MSIRFPIYKVIKICTLYTKPCFFPYNGIFYEQKSGLSMAQILGGVLISLSLHF